MSLRYWFPLIKDIKNYGLSQVGNFNDASDLSSFGNGKLGQSYYANSSHYLCDAPIDFTLGEELSIALWVRPMAFENTYNYLFQLMNDNSTSYANTVCGLCVEPNASTPRFKLVIGGSSSEYFTLADRLILNEWCHIAIVWKDNKEYLYLNGLPQVYIDGINPNSALHATSLNIGCNKNGNNGINAYLNDLRIYDHALSTKEINEIGKGLLLHYKFNKMETKNYLTPPYDRSDKYNTTGVISSTSTNHYTNVITTARIDPLPGPGIYTYSAYIYNTSNANICVSCRLCNSNGEDLGSWVYGNYILSGEEGLSTVTIDGTALADVASAKGRLYYSKSLADMTSEFSYQYFKFEQSPFYTYWTPYEKVPSLITYDCSGFSYNGTATQSLPIIKDSPRYDAALKFDGTSYVSCVSPCAEARTISFWANFDSVPSGATSIFMDYKSKMGFGISNSQNFICSTRGISSKMFSKPELSANTWYHFVIVAPNGADDTARQLYINGIEQTPISSSSYWTYNIDQLQVGKRSSSSDGFVGKISDVRVYATALTAAAIKELYNTSMTVDASGNVYARELVQL